MTELRKVLESGMKIRFHDCDPFNHLNNSRYIDYIMTARGDQLIEHYGFDIYALARTQGIGWVTAQTDIAYVLPASVMEDVIIQTRLLSYSEKTLLFEAIMFNHDKTLVKAVMWSRLVHFDLAAKRSAVHSDEHMDFFSQVANPHEAAYSFEERVISLKTR